MNFLFIRPDKAGDAIKSLPALRALKKIGPSGNYFILGSSFNRSLFETEPGYSLLSMEEAKQKKWDKIILLPCDFFPEFHQLLEPLSGEKYSFRESLPDYSPKKKDETLNITALLSKSFSIDLAHEVKHSEAAPILLRQDHEEAEKKMGEKKGKRIGFCPFAGTDQRTHPLHTWEKFIRSVNHTKLFEKIFVFGSPSEIKKISALPKEINLISSSSFRSLGAYLLRLDGVISVDSGPLHLAHSLKIPLLGFFSGGDTERWLPHPHEKSKVLSRGIFKRYPTYLEMKYHFSQWAKSL